MYAVLGVGAGGGGVWGGGGGCCWCGGFGGWGPGLAPAGDFLFFASPKKRKQKKGDPAVGVPSLRYGQPAVLAFRGVRANSLRSNTRGPDPRKALLLGTLRRECSGRRFARH